MSGSLADGGISDFASCPDILDVSIPTLRFTGSTEGCGDLPPPLPAKCTLPGFGAGETRKLGMFSSNLQVELEDSCIQVKRLDGAPACTT